MDETKVDPVVTRHDLNTGLYSPDRVNRRFAFEDIYQVQGGQELGSGLCTAVVHTLEDDFRHCNGKVAGRRQGKLVCANHFISDVVHFVKPFALPIGQVER